MPLLLKLDQKRTKFAKGDRIKVVPKWNQDDTSNITCGRKIKTRSIWNFRGNVFMKVVSLKFQT